MREGFEDEPNAVGMCLTSMMGSVYARAAGVVALLTLASVGCSSAAAPGGARHPSSLGSPVVTPPTSGSTVPARADCPPVHSLNGRSAVSIDYVDFVQVGGRSFIAGLDRRAGSVRADQLGRVVVYVRCSFSELNDRTGQAPAAQRDGDAGFLPAGTAVYAVNGWSPRCRLAARHDGALRVYLAYRPGGRVATPEPCALRSVAG